MSHAQLHPDGRLRHLLSLEGLPAAVMLRLLERAQSIRPKALQGEGFRHLLAGRTVCTLFFEPSTRTRSSFQLAGKRLGADTLNFNVATSSSAKGETALDTLRNLEAMGVDCFVVRHAEDGAVAALAAGAGPDTRVVNAGDGRSNHPTQGLLDMLTLRQHKGADLSRLKVLIAGDIRHSRVARSNLQAMAALGVGEVRLCGPDTLLPEADSIGTARIVRDFDAALEGVDAVMMLRLQRERMEEGLVPSLEGYFRDYGLTASRLKRAQPDAIVMHPGPMNRGVEIADDVADGPQSVILQQVANGVALRMAVLAEVMGC